MDLMIDIETLATGFNAKLLSIGAVIFDPNKIQSMEELQDKRQHQFHTVVDVTKYEGAMPFISDNKTLTWWAGQQEAFAILISAVPKFSPNDTLDRFIDWCKGNYFDKVWAKPPSFDLAILRYHFSIFNKQCPWHYKKEWDVRTIQGVVHACRHGQDVSPKFKYIKHYAYHDAIAQASVVQQCYDALRNTHGRINKNNKNNQDKERPEEESTVEQTAQAEDKLQQEGGETRDTERTRGVSGTERSPFEGRDLCGLGAGVICADVGKGCNGFCGNMG